jgi:hypothetical protein
MVERARLPGQSPWQAARNSGTGRISTDMLRFIQGAGNGFGGFAVAAIDRRTRRLRETLGHRLVRHTGPVDAGAHEPPIA